MKSRKNVKTDRLTIRIDVETKKDIIEFAKDNSLSVGWVLRRAWQEFKDSVKKGTITL